MARCCAGHRVGPHILTVVGEDGRAVVVGDQVGGGGVRPGDYEMNRTAIGEDTAQLELERDRPPHRVGSADCRRNQERIARAGGRRIDNHVRQSRGGYETVVDAQLQRVGAGGREGHRSGGRGGVGDLHRRGAARQAPDIAQRGAGFELEIRG